MGQPIGSRYELDEQLGRGAFGSVWRGHVRDTGEAVAVKVLLEELAVDPDVVTRFLRERTALVGLRHRSLVSIRDLVVEGDVLALVMQLVEGPDLRAYLRGRGTLGPEEAALLVADVADALAVAHAAKIIHRDVKPANVLLQPEAGGFRPLLTDFGIARLADAPSVTRTSQVVGTPYYLAPEVISGRKATGAVDIYAAGIMFYELLTGRPPFRGRDAMEVFRAHQTATPQRPPGVSDRLWAVALAALGKDPELRPLAGELASRLRAAVQTKQDGTTVRLPVNPSEGTVVLPALAAEEKIAAGAGGGAGRVAGAAGAVAAAGAGAGAHAAPHAVWPGRAPQAQPTGPGTAQGNGSAAPQAAQPQQSPVQPAQSPAPRAASAQQSPNGGAQVIPINRGAQIAPTTPIARTPANQPTTALPPVAQRPAVQPPASQQPASNAAPARPYAAPTPAPQQSNPYPMAYQQSPRPAQPMQQSQRSAPPVQYRPPQQPAYQPPRNKAPRQPQTYSPTASARPAGLSCLSKLAILVIVLAIAVAVGVTVGRQLAKHHTTTGFGPHASRSSVSVPAVSPISPAGRP